MNKNLETYARKWLKESLELLTADHRSFFVRLYKTSDGQTWQEVVDTMPVDKLDWAMQQVGRTLIKRTKQKEKSHE
jgi:3-methyladenine DNA glycosylase AlkC